MGMICLNFSNKQERVEAYHITSVCCLDPDSCNMVIPESWFRSVANFLVMMKSPRRRSPW